MTQFPKTNNSVLPNQSSNSSVSFLWEEVVVRLEKSVERDLSLDDPKILQKAIRFVFDAKIKFWKVLVLRFFVIFVNIILMYV